MIDTRNKIVFIHIPKTGGSSIVSSLLTLQGIDADGSHFGPELKESFAAGHHTALQIKEELLKRGENWNDYWKFSIVRNPFDRIDSSYNWHHLTDRYRYSNCSELTFLKKKDYVKYADYLFDNEMNLMVDKVYKFEQGINNIYSEIEKKIKYILPRKKAKMVDKITKFKFTDTVKNFIQNESSFDFDYFGYDRETLP